MGPLGTVSSGQTPTGEPRLGRSLTPALEAHSCRPGPTLPMRVTPDSGGRKAPPRPARPPPALTLTEGGGDSRPMRGVFSQRGFWKFAFWLLRCEEREP